MNSIECDCDECNDSDNSFIFRQSRMPEVSVLFANRRLCVFLISACVIIFQNCSKLTNIESTAIYVYCIL